MAHTALTDDKTEAGEPEFGQLDGVVGFHIRLAHGAVYRHFTETFAELGLTLGGLSDEARKQYSLRSDLKGVLVTSVDPNGAAAEKGFQPGDVIVEASQEEVHSPSEVAEKIEAAKKAGRKSILLLVEGQAGLRFVALRLGGPKEKSPG